MAGKLTKLASGVLMTHYTKSRVDTAVLVDITREVGAHELADAVAGANTARHAYELWEAAGVLRPAGDLLCARVAEVLTRFGGLPRAWRWSTRPAPGRRRDRAGLGARVITVVGTDGGPLPDGARERLRTASLVMGGRRHLRDVELPAGVRTIALRDDPGAALRAVADEPGDVVVLASGDPGFFGVVRAVRRAVRPRPVEVLPALSSVALAFGRAGVEWDDAVVVSAHGRDPPRRSRSCARSPRSPSSPTSAADRPSSAPRSPAAPTGCWSWGSGSGCPTSGCAS
jgi:precorrin-6y C5,15-methyltransferase (decarboxylating) CbiE subunit